MKIIFSKGNLKLNLQILPKDLQKKIYRITWRLFWRSFTPITAQIPTWYSRYLKIQKELYEAKYKNIHFMHLSFNCLPENKKWIMGCQCNYCKTYGKGKLGRSYKRREYLKLLNDPYYLDTYLPNTTCSDWNEHIIVSPSPKKIFDPYCGSLYESLEVYAVRENKQILQFNLINQIVAV